MAPIPVSHRKTICLGHPPGTMGSSDKHSSKACRFLVAHPEWVWACVKRDPVQGPSYEARAKTGRTIGKGDNCIGLEASQNR